MTKVTKAKEIAKARGRASRNKGKRGERQLAQILTLRGFPARRGVQFKGGLNSPDVICDSLEFIHFEAKWVESLNLRDAYKQAKDDAGLVKIPVVVHKKSNREILLTMSFFDWINLIQCVMIDGDSDSLNTVKRLVDEQRDINSRRSEDSEAEEAKSKEHRSLL